MSSDTLSTHSHDEQAHPGARLGPLLCWAVVFADIGTSVYYTPGILFQQSGVGLHAALFVSLTMLVFLLLAGKYAEVTVRYPEGGGVVTVGARAIHPFVGLIGGMFILVDYFLTAAISADSGVVYLSDVFPSLVPIILPITLLALIVLGVLNWVGISESARVSALFAIIAFISQIAVLVAVTIHIGLGQVFATIPLVLHGARLTPLTVLTGYAGAFLAFSGLESISQLSPVMQQPRQRVARVAMGMVVITIALTSPLLTLLSTTLLDASKADPNQFISLLGGFAAGKVLEWEVAISGALLLIFASNTAVIGTYHVFLALSRMRFFPRFIEQRNTLRGTPHWAIVLAVGIPLLVLIASQGNLSLLGDLYAFGLLGAFSVTCVSLDVVRWRERRFASEVAASLAQVGAEVVPTAEVAHNGSRPAEQSLGQQVDHQPVSRAVFIVGVLTTVLVVLAWSTNLFAKPLATLFGGSVTTVGLVVALVNYARLNKSGMPVAFPSEIRSALTDAVLVLLPTLPELADEVAKVAALTAAGRPVVFVYRGQELQPMRRPRMFEVVDPYLDDRSAQEAFGRAERIGRKQNLDRRYIYLPASQGKAAMMRIWQTIRPSDTLITPGDESSLQGIAADRIRRSTGGSTPILHYLKQW